MSVQKSKSLLDLIQVAQRLALPACGWAWTMFGSRKKPKARKILLNRADSHTSGARFVGTLFPNITFASNKNHFAPIPLFDLKPKISSDKNHYLLEFNLS